jgi:hypothetical protein
MAAKDTASRPARDNLSSSLTDVTADLYNKEVAR